MPINNISTSELSTQLFFPSDISVIRPIIVLKPAVTVFSIFGYYDRITLFFRSFHKKIGLWLKRKKHVSS